MKMIASKVVFREVSTKKKKMDNKLKYSKLKIANSKCIKQLLLKNGIPCKNNFTEKR
jgi:hypothetical protein